MHNNFGNRVSQPVEKFLHDLEAGEHGCIFYFSKDEMQKKFILILLNQV